MLKISVVRLHESGRLRDTEDRPVVLVGSLDRLADDRLMVSNQIVHRGERFRSGLSRTRQRAE